MVPSGWQRKPREVRAETEWTLSGQVRNKTLGRLGGVGSQREDLELGSVTCQLGQLGIFFFFLMFSRSPVRSGVGQGKVSP